MDEAAERQRSFAGSGIGNGREWVWVGQNDFGLLLAPFLGQVTVALPTVTRAGAVAVGSGSEVGGGSRTKDRVQWQVGLLCVQRGHKKNGLKIDGSTTEES